MTKNEQMILLALADGANIKEYRHLNKELHLLDEQGYLKCIFDEQNTIISAKITPEGKNYIHNELRH